MIEYNLCVYDSRHPDYEELCSLYENEEDIPRPRDGCSCDSCFYHRDELALEILRLRNIIEGNYED